MIRLKRNETVEIYQVELDLKVKTKQSPFIPILIFVQEQNGINAEILQEKLLDSLPLRACDNLLKRLEQQGYLEQVQKKMVGNRKKNDDVFIYYSLTELGERCAIDQSFWVGEKGVYDVLVCKSDLINQRIIKTVKVDRTEDDRTENKTTYTPNEISQYENQILEINNSDVRFENIEGKCFRLKPIICTLEIQVKGNESILKISKDNQNLFQIKIAIEETDLQEQLLSQSDEFEYDKDKKAIKVEFSKDNLNLKRIVKIIEPIFQKVLFNQVEIENVCHIPNNKKNADLWLNELLFNGINGYFIDDNSFNEYANVVAEPICLHYKVHIPDRKEQIELLSKRNDAFYQSAKIDTIDYLNY